jgi:hypothetical protein
MVTPVRIVVVEILIFHSQVRHLVGLNEPMVKRFWVRHRNLECHYVAFGFRLLMAGKQKSTSVLSTSDRDAMGTSRPLVEA